MMTERRADTNNDWAHRPQKEQHNSKWERTERTLFSVYHSVNTKCKLTSCEGICQHDIKTNCRWPGKQIERVEEKH